MAACCEEASPHGMVGWRTLTLTLRPLCPQVGMGAVLGVLFGIFFPVPA